MENFKVGFVFFVLGSVTATATMQNDASKLLAENSARTAAVIQLNQQEMERARQLVRNLSQAEASALAASRNSPYDFAARRAYERARDERVQAERDLRKRQSQGEVLVAANQQNSLASWARSDSQLTKGQVLALAAGVGIAGGAIGMAIGASNSQPSTSPSSDTASPLRAAIERQQRAQQVQFSELSRSIDRYAASQSAKVVTPARPPSAQIAVIPATLPRY